MPNKRERDQLRTVINESYAEEITKIKSQYTRLGLNEDHLDCVKAIGIATIERDRKLRRLDEADDLETERDENNWKYENWLNTDPRFH